MTPEGEEKALVRKYLRELGAYQFWPVQMMYGSRTIDILACVAGHFVGIEVKKKGWVPSDFTTRQRVVMGQISDAHGQVFSGDSDQIIDAMKAWLKRPFGTAFERLNPSVVNPSDAK